MEISKFGCADAVHSENSRKDGLNESIVEEWRIKMNILTYGV